MSAIKRIAVAAFWIAMAVLAWRFGMIGSAWDRLIYAASETFYALCIWGAIIGTFALLAVRSKDGLKSAVFAVVALSLLWGVYSFANGPASFSTEGVEDCERYPGPFGC